MADILVVIEEQFLPELSQIYRDVSWAPYVYSFIETAIKWKNKGRKELTTFVSPNSCWREDGTFFALMQFGNYDVFMFTLDPDCSNLRKGIFETKKIDWNKHTVLFNLNSIHYPFVMSEFSEMNLTVNYCIIHDMYVLNEETVLNFNLECPPEVYLKPLQTSNAPLIDSLYKTSRHRYPDSDRFISTLIEMNRGLGLFLKESDELVAWVMRTCLGQIGFLQTAEDHHKKGYACFLLKAIAKEIVDDGFVPMGAISQSNLASISAFKKVGFCKHGSCYFLEVNKLN